MNLEERKEVYKKGEKFGQSIEQFVSQKIRYDDDPISPKNGIEDRIQRGEEYLGRLTTLLHSKGVLSDSEVIELSEPYSYSNEYEIR